MAVWMIKWSVFIGATFALIGWIFGDEIVTSQVDLVLNAIGDSGVWKRGYRNDNAGMRTRQRTRKPYPKRRPRAWDSFHQHREWQVAVDHDAASDGSMDVREIIAGVYETLKDGWWKAVGKEAVKDSAGSTDETRRRRAVKSSKVR